jgi:hypothetical protein
MGKTCLIRLLTGLYTAHLAINKKNGSTFIVENIKVLIFQNRIVPKSRQYT